MGPDNCPKLILDLDLKKRLFRFQCVDNRENLRNRDIMSIKKLPDLKPQLKSL